MTYDLEVRENSEVEICVWSHCHRRFGRVVWGKGREEKL